MITLKSKQKFLTFILENFLDKDEEMNWLLKYLRKDEELLKNCQFIENVNEVPRGLFFNFLTPKKQVILLKGKNYYVDLPQIFHDVRLHKTEILYIEVKFLNRWENLTYLEVLEDNPYFSWNDQINQKLKKDVRNSFLKEELTLLEEKLDASLLSGNQKEFSDLAKVFKEIKKETPSKDL